MTIDDTSFPSPTHTFLKPKQMYHQLTQNPNSLGVLYDPRAVVTLDSVYMYFAWKTFNSAPLSTEDSTIEVVSP